MRLILKIFIAILIPAYSFGQPSSSMNFAFRLYDDNGKAIDAKSFCKNWKVINPNGPELSTCEQSVVNYSRSNKYFNIRIGAIYPPYVITFVSKQDTMTLFFTEYRSNTICDSLSMRIGNFLIKSECSENQKVSLTSFAGMSYCPMKNIDWEQLRENFNKSGY